MKMIVILAAAFILDLIIGDPHWLPHPICLIGKAISGGEKLARKCIRHEFAAGAVLTVCVVGLSFLVPFFLLFLAGLLHPLAADILQVIFCYQILAVKSLKTESMRVFKPLKEGDMPLARKYLSWIVGRDTQSLDEAGVAKAAVETVAENTTDGVVAPLLFMAIGGAPLGFLYKAINTLDSMIGYKNEKYIRFGTFAAKLDDVANFLPARIAALLMVAAAPLVGLDGKNGYRIFKRDRYNHKSPNSAQTESVCAGALHIQLAGSASYFGQMVEKPTIGEPDRPVAVDDIRLANRLMVGTAVLALILVLAVRAAVCLPFILH